MPITYLWAVNSEGKVYLLSSGGQQWEEMHYDGVNMKRVSALEHCAWALAGDNQIYLYVVTSDVPIRCKEVTYENQRWFPSNGFSNTLLPTDRPGWSSQDGLVERDKDKIALPTSSWEWESEWMIDDSLDGQPLGQEGWTYAVDFPYTYGREKKFTSLVRRRRWSRYRRFVAVDRWIPIPGISSDSLLEPFIDISIGGLELPGGETGDLLVWAVTIHGRVMFRQGVTRERPEGNGWIHVESPSGREISNISVGPTGLVWALTWDGEAFARSGVTRNKATGSNWLPIESARDDCSLLQVSVGMDVVWAVSRDSRIWFRKGIHGNESGTSDKAAIGSGWVEMIGSMSMVSVGPNDQVWAVSKNEPNIINFRTGVTHQDLNGKRWKEIVLPLVNRVDNDVSSETSQPESGITIGRDSDVSGTETDSEINLNNLRIKSLEQKCSSTGDITSPRVTRGSFSSSQDSMVGTDDDFLADLDAVVEQCYAWLWISAAACHVDPLHIPNWFSSNFMSNKHLLSEPWRKEIVSKLTSRCLREINEFKYEQAVDKGSWKKTGRCHYFKDNQWFESRLELEQTSNDENVEGTLTISCNNTVLAINLSDITCLVCGSDHNKPILSIFKERKDVDNSKNTCNRIAFPSDTELEDWVAVLSSTCCDIRHVIGTPSPQAVWALTNRGDIFSHNPQIDDVPRLHEMFWRQLGGHLKSVETSACGVVWGLSYSHVPYVYTEGWGGGIFQGLASSSFGIHSMWDVRQMYIYENQRWNPLTGFSAHGLPTDRYMWSDATGKYECTKENTRLPSMHWQWVMDWTIDYHAPGGVDREGWQYAKDFPRTYHSRKGLTDYVRRRRWKRKCKLNTSGPWDSVESVPLVEVSFQVDHPGAEHSDDPLHTWAVDHKGNVLYRHGVTKLNPKGTRWEHVPGDDSFCSVSVGANKRVWAVSRDGSAFFRSGITDNNPTGAMWFHVEPPDEGVLLRQVSVGGTSVWSVDQNGGLWYRQEVMPMFPEGTCWKSVGDEVHKVSVNLHDEVWVIAKQVNTPNGAMNGVVCRRKNITPENKIGAGWDYGIGCGWNHISIRGCNEYYFKNNT